MSAPLPEARQLLAAVQAIRPTVPHYPPDAQVSGPNMYQIMRHINRKIQLDNLERQLTHFIREWEHYDTEGVP